MEPAAILPPELLTLDVSKMKMWQFRNDIRGYKTLLRLAGSAAVCAMLAISAITLLTQLASAQDTKPAHAISMHGEPALSPDFNHFPYANPDAPKGGSLTHGVIGTFDSLNPFVLKSMRTTARGMWDPVFGKLIFEPLMTRSADEPFTLYGLIAESVVMPEDRSWMEFNLNEDAKWSDGKQITPEDVIFTYELLTEHGRPPFNSRMKRIEKIEKTGDRSVKFKFNDQSDREFPLIVAGFMPVLPKHATNIEDFADSTLEPPVGSGPYLIESVEPGQHITYQRRNGYWGKDLPVNRGHLNHDSIRIEYFRSSQARFEAFKKGLFQVYEEGDPSQWERAYDFPAVTDGRVTKEAFEKQTPAAMLAFFFNTRRPVFKDPKVREALAMLFDFEWVNKNLFFDVYKRTGSFWQGSQLSALGVPANEFERNLLAPFPDLISDDVMEGKWQPPASDGSGRDRKILRAALKLLSQAAYKQQGGKLVDSSGKPLTFEILTKSEDEEKLAIAYKRSLDLVGINASIRAVDDAQYQRRTQDFDYDMIIATLSTSLSPGNEQINRWGSLSRDIAGTFNYAGASEPAIDAAIDSLLGARSAEDFQSSVRALDRLLISGNYVIPLFHLSNQWIAKWNVVEHPEITPIYGNQYTVWWAAEE